MADRFVDSNGIRLHYLEHPGGEPALVLLPGLTANAHVFDGLVEAGLSPRYRVLALDLRGRGESAKPSGGYSLADHAADVLGLLDAYGMRRAVIGGHSFGALVALFLAARYPQRVDKLILLDIDTASAVHPRTSELIKPALDRLGRSVPSWEAYLEAMRANYHGWWHPAIESYYRADVETLGDGSIRSKVRPEIIAEVMEQVIGEDWDAHLAAVQAPALLLNAPESAGAPGTPPVIAPDDARAMAARLPDCRYAQVPGGHMTMLFGAGAHAIVNEIQAFIG